MTPERHAQIKRLFLEACAIPPEKRDAYLKQACGGDAELIAAVGDLLARRTSEPSDATETMAISSVLPAASAGHADESELASGTVVAERYRIVSRLGEGGMGVVYRADDLRLHQPVALKFLPRQMARDPAWRGILEREVRAARLVTHPNVCRVHDLTDADGQTFITMEYIDGENLKSLLRRIGRLPTERAVQIAQQLCIALATIHRAGIVHRDLKPANVMIDAAGNVRVTDFGIAGTHVEPSALSTEAGTPAYMAPEQFAGAPASFASDIYALGQTLYEVFTGAPAFDARSFAELAEQKTGSRIKRPSQIVADIPGHVERVLLACLESRPARRPTAALAVGAAISGGEMLALALAAGELPSPELVAAAGESSTFPIWLPPACLIACAVLLVAVVLLAPRVHPVVRGDFPKSAEALAERARMLIAEQAPQFRAVDEAYGLAAIETIEEHGTSLRRRGGGDTAVFWYRAAPRRFIPIDGMNQAFYGGAVTPADPPRDPNEQFILLDGQGSVVQPESRIAAEGKNENGTTVGVRASRVEGARATVLSILFLTSIPVAVMNVRQGRADRGGAMRLGLASFVLCLVAWLLRTHVIADIGLMRRSLALGLAGALLQGALLWLVYTALEPYVRRYWPQALISWTRALDGRWRDPLVGMHVLVGVVLGMVFAILTLLDSTLPPLLGLSSRPSVRLTDAFVPLTSALDAGASILHALWQSVHTALFMPLLVVICRAVVRHGIAAYAIATVIFAATFVPLGAHPATAAVCYTIAVVLGVWLLIRCGPVTLAIALFVSQLLVHMPVTLNLRVWYAGYGLSALLIAGGLAIAGYLAARRLHARPGF